MTWLAIVGAVGSIVSLGYYLRVVGVMWLPAPRGGAPQGAAPCRGRWPWPRSPPGWPCVALALFASPVLDACRGAAESLLAA